MQPNKKIETLETQLNDFSLETRREALAELMVLAQQGNVELMPPSDVANMH